MNANTRKILFLFACFLLPALLCFGFYYFVIRKPIVNKDASIFKSLPIIGERDIDPLTKDTIYHTIPAFQLINENNELFDSRELDGKIYVADFFFTTCKSICPKMSSEMARVQKKLSYLKKNFHLVSFTVNPENDTAAVLKNYANMVHANEEMWTFLTGDKKLIYDLGKNAYLINAIDPDGVGDDFLHSEFLILVDKEKRVRGFYDGTSISEVNRLMDEVKVLNASYALAKK